MAPHVVIYGACALFFANSELFAGFDMTFGDLYDLASSTLFFKRCHESGQQQVAVSFFARAALQSEGKHRPYPF